MNRQDVEWVRGKDESGTFYELKVKGTPVIVATIWRGGVSGYTWSYNIGRDHARHLPRHLHSGVSNDLRGAQALILNEVCGKEA